MAEENTQEVAPKSSKTMLIVILVVVVNLIIAGVVIVVFVMGGKDSEAAKSEASAAAVAPTNGPGTLLPMENFVVNIKGEEGGKYLKASIVLEMKGETAADMFAKWEKLLRNEVLVYLSSLDVEETRSVKQKRAIETKLKEILNGRIGSNEILGVYFTEFVTQ